MSPATTPRPLIVTRSPELLTDLQRLCAAASVSPEVVGDPGSARRSWADASCVLVGDDCSQAVAAFTPGRRDGVVLVGYTPESSGLWQRGIAIRAEQVIVLPDGQQSLIERLTDSADGTGARAVTIGVMGARGGAGASTVAAALALTAARRGDVTLLVDADARAGGIQLVVGCEEEQGLRWPEVATTEGRVSATALRAALPSAAGLAVLSCTGADQPPLEPATVRAMVVAGQRGSDVVIVDLPRSSDAWACEVVHTIDVLLLVCTLDVRAVAAAGCLLHALRASCPDIRLVVRRQPGDPLEPETVSDTLRVPIAAQLPTQRSVQRAVDDGLGPIVRGRTLRRYEALLDSVGVASVGRAR